MNHLVTLSLAMLVLVLLVTVIFGFMSGVTTYWAWIALALLLGIPWLHRRLSSLSYLTWKEAYSVKVQALDDDHKRLLHLINNLHTAAHYRTDANFERQALNEVVDYTKTHFAREEELMQKYQYPDYAAHKRQHEDMIEKVNDLVQRYEMNRDAVIEELLKYLREWLINHIQGTDQKYSQHLSSHGVQ